MNLHGKIRRKRLYQLNLPEARVLLYVDTNLFSEAETGRKIMREKSGLAKAARWIAVVVLAGVAWRSGAQDAKAVYPKMAPVEQYLMEDRNAEISLARSAAPESIARDATVLVLGRHGYETAVQGKNGFVCLVERSWTAGIDFPEFWNPKLHGPICYNAPAARTYVNRILKKTDLVLAGNSKEQMFQAITAAVASKELPPIESGSMSYMLSKQGYLGDQNGHWHPHLMFFFEYIAPDVWGANQKGSPIFALDDKVEHVTEFLVPVMQWSDGTTDH
jgi:hypothetical protein